MSATPAAIPSACDVVIAGGGLVGAALACALAPLGLRILVVEAVPPRLSTQPSFDDRNSALSFGSRRILDGLGLWSDLAPQVGPIRHIHISDRGRLGRAELHAHENGVDALGFVAPNRVLGQVLWARMGALPGLALACPATVESLAQTADAVRCRVVAGGIAHEVSAALVVVADGAGSKLRDHLGVGASRWEYGQSAVIANVTTERDPAGWAYERFCEQGPVALLPLVTGDMATIITVPTEEAAALATGEPAAYAAVLTERFGARLGAFQRIGTRAHYPLALVRAEEQVVGRAVIMGNAAHALHPVAAQGFNLSLRDVAALAEVVADTRQRTGGDIGDPAALARYREWRAGDQREMSLFSDGVARVFSNPLKSVGLVRSLGLLAFDLLPPAKRRFAQHMMGLAGRLPRLARGLPLIDPAPLTPSPLGRGPG